MDFSRSDSFGNSLDPENTEVTEELQEQGDQIDFNSVEAWRRYFADKRLKQKRPKVPLWIFDEEKPKAAKLKVQSIRIESVRRTFLQARSLFWDEMRQNLYFVDEMKKVFVRYSPARDDLRVATFEGTD